MNLEQEHSFMFKEFFNKVSIQFNKTCSERCGVKMFEEYMCKIKKGVNIQEMNYATTLECYDNCLAKHFYSTILGVSQMEEKFLV